MLHNRNADDCPIARPWQHRALAGTEPYSFDLLPSVELVNRQVWNALVPADHATLTWEYLQAQERGTPSTDHHRYLIIRDGITPLGIAYLHCTTFEGEPIDTLLGERAGLTSVIAKGLGLTGRRLTMPVVVVGNPFTTGDPPGLSPLNVISEEPSRPYRPP